MKTESASEQAGREQPWNVIGGFLGIIAGLAGLLWGIFLRDKSGVDVLWSGLPRLVLLAVLLVIAAVCCLLWESVSRQNRKK